MSRGKYERKGKSFPILRVMLIVLLLVALSSAGVAAYLAMTSEKDLSNTFVTAQHPNPQVVAQGGSYRVDVGNPGYAVYVRAAVVPSLKHNGEVIPASSFSVTPAPNWFESGGFYYYSLPISSGTTTPIYTAISSPENPNGSLDVDIAVQVIQALGTTDEANPQTAVLNAWGVHP